MSNKKTTLKDLSKVPVIKEREAKITLEELKVSALLRIAESTETIANSYTELFDKYKKLDIQNNRLQSENQGLKRTIANNQSLTTKLQQKEELV